MLTVSHILSVFALAALGVSVQAQSSESELPFALQSPRQFVQCKNTTIVWQGGKAPYKVTLTPVCDSGKNASEETHSLSEPGSTSIELPIRFAKDTPIIVSITDSTNMQATAPQTIVASGDEDDSCAIQTACTKAQAPSVPNAVANPISQSTSSGFPTDHLVTSDPSATSAQPQSMTDASSSGSTMVVIYSYASPTSTPSATAQSVTQNQPNAAILTGGAPTFATLGFVMLVGVSLALGI